MKKHTYKERFVRYIHRTYLNKLYAILMLMTGGVAAVVSGGDVTFLVIMSFIAVPLFFARKNWIES